MEECKNSNPCEPVATAGADSSRPKILLAIMVKNEANILARCLRSVRPHVDAMYIADTGSSDTTVAIAESQQWGSEPTDMRAWPLLPLKADVHRWMNFGHNRTQTFRAAVAFASRDLGWDTSVPGRTYALVIDADMVLECKPQDACLSTILAESLAQRSSIGKSPAASMAIVQNQGHLQYSNARLLDMAWPWQCIGVTHEYWSAPGDQERDYLPSSRVWLRDIGDGGCKQNKFQRDLALLTQGLVDEPGNVRYMFYLAQTHKDLYQHTEAIKWYKARIAAGGWDEELWYSMYMIATVWLRSAGTNKDHEQRAERWAQRAFAFRPHRAEPLVMMVTHFRDTSQHFKAWQYLLQAEGAVRQATITYDPKTPSDVVVAPKQDLLFVEMPAYVYALPFERCVLQYYISKEPACMDAGATACLQVINCLQAPSANQARAYDNMRFYARPLDGMQHTRLDFSEFVKPGWKSSSLSVDATGRFMVVRSVDYKVLPCGTYVLADGRTVNTRNFVVTRRATGANGWSGADVQSRDGQRPWSAREIIMEPDAEAAGRRTVGGVIIGLEDLRMQSRQLSRNCMQLQLSGTTREFGSTNCIACGNCELAMNADAGTLRTPIALRTRVLSSPTGVVEGTCEKNWIALDDGKSYIYSWSPYRVVAFPEVSGGTPVDVVNIASGRLPTWFKYLRGSAPPFWYNDKLWCVVHCVVGHGPRTYLHAMVTLDPITYLPTGYTVPFTFQGKNVEYCLSAHVWDDTLHVFYSLNDESSWVGRMPMKDAGLLAMDWR